MKGLQRKEVFALFHERFGKKLLEHGFLCKANAYYRKNGSIFQLIGLDLSSSCVHVCLWITPFWYARAFTDRFPERLTDFPDQVHSQSSMNKLVDSGFDLTWYNRPILSKETVDFSLFPDSENEDTLFQFTDQEVEELFFHLDQVRDEETYCLCAKKRVFKFLELVAAPIALYVSFRQNSFDDAKAWCEGYKKSTYEFEIANFLKNECPSSPYFQKPFWTVKNRFFIEFDDLTPLLDWFREAPLAPKVKESAHTRAMEKVSFVSDIRLSKIEDCIEKNDFQMIRQYYDEEAPVMRDFFLRNFGLDFSE